jgi:hypothetical protein
MNITKALASVLDDLSDTHIKLLITHYKAPKHTATAEWLAQKMGWRDYRAVNMHYGMMAHRVADLLGWPKPGVDAWVFNLFDWTDPYSVDSHGHVRFVQKPEVGNALKLQGYVR